MIKIGLYKVDGGITVFIGLDNEAIENLRLGLTVRTSLPPSLPLNSEVLLCWGATDADLEKEVKAMIGDAPMLTAWPGEGKDS